MGGGGARGSYLAHGLIAYTFDIYTMLFSGYAIYHGLKIFICLLMVANKSIVQCELGVYIFLRVIYIHVELCYLIKITGNKIFI